MLEGVRSYSFFCEKNFLGKLLGNGVQSVQSVKSVVFINEIFAHFSTLSTLRVRRVRLFSSEKQKPTEKPIGG